MPTLKWTVDVKASKEEVWRILADPLNIEKFATDILLVKAEPPGLAVVGQKVRVVGKVRGKRVEFRAEHSEVIDHKLIKMTYLPSSLFRQLEAITVLETTSDGTKVTDVLTYELSKSLLMRSLGSLVVRQALKKNLGQYWKKLKRFAEL